MSKILLEDMEFYAYHGHFKEEQVIGNRFILNLELSLDTSKAQESDLLKDTVNYQAVYNLVRESMQQKSHLLEHIAKRVLDVVFENFPEIQGAKLKISKMNPPLGGKVHAVSIVLER